MIIINEAQSIFLYLFQPYVNITFIIIIYEM